MSDWCVLRTAGPRTLKLVRSLNEAGFDAWAPIAMQRHRRPRSSKFRDVETAALPTFVFAAYRHESDLLAIQHSPLTDHPPFTVFQHDGRPVRVSTAALEPLREYEARLAGEWQAFCEAEDQAALKRARRKKTTKKRGRANARRSYVLGQRVRVVDPAFEGLTGTVIEARGNGHLKIAIGGIMEIQVEACDLSPVPVGEAEPIEAKAA